MTTHDSVNHPLHYCRNGLECLDVIRAELGDGFEAYCIGNVQKYIWRYRDKNGTEDLEKARFYLDCVIQGRKAEE